jgi:hypothetical protein
MPLSRHQHAHYCAAICKDSLVRLCQRLFLLSLLCSSEASKLIVSKLCYLALLDVLGIAIPIPHS